MAAAEILANSDANIFIFDDNNPRPSSIKKTHWQNYKEWPWKNLISLIVSPSIPTNNFDKHEAVELAVKHNVKIINEIDVENAIIKDYNKLVDSIIEKIQKLERWNDFIEFEGKKYGLINKIKYRHNEKYNVHIENDCFGEMVFTRKETTYT